MRYLIYFSGLPGTGKTTVANKLRKIINHSLIISRNLVRDWISDFTDNESEEELIYKIMEKSSDVALLNGYSVIIDGAGWKNQYYRNFKKMSQKNGAVFISIRLVCNLQTSRVRTQKRKRDCKWNAKDLMNFKKIFEKIPTDIVANSNNASADEILQTICERINLKI